MTAWSGNRKPDPLRQSPSQATPVDVKNVTYTNATGAVELKKVGGILTSIPA
jgi:hypothetical protein